MRLKFAGPALALVLALAPVAVGAQDAPPIPKGAIVAAQSLKPQRGKVTLPEAHATLNLGTDYDFYGPDDARKILVDIWGNPPGSADGVLGLVMPAGKGPLTDAWGAVVTYEASGYVEDKDAAQVNYNELLTQMKDGQAEENAERTKQGYPEINLVGWAESPHYDAGSHSVVWARNLKFADSPVNTLNYDVRTLGRAGVLSLNLISQMPRLGEVKRAAADFASHASFDKGSRYEDFDPSLDDKAAYGIGGLVAAGVGVAAAKKLGILALLLKFIKPILIGALALFGALRNKIMGLFGRTKGPLEGDDY